MQAVKQWIDGYDMGIWYADLWVGKLLDKLEELDLLDEVVIIVSSDHSEAQGEFDIWGDHQTADESVSKVPLLIRWPGITDASENGPAGRVDSALHYHFDWAATLIDMVGGVVPPNWDGQSFADAFKNGKESGREYLVISQGAWSAQRSVRFEHAGESWLCLRTYHDGHKKLEPVMLFNLTQDPHEQHDLHVDRPDLVEKAMGMLAEWQHEMMLRSESNIDPLMTILREGGPSHTRYQLPAYLERLKRTGRTHHAERLAKLHPDEVGS
jgi:arylsulfatase A-like enzyme